MTEINPLILGQIAPNPVKETAANKTQYNIINVKTAEEAGKIANKEIGTMPYRIATAGYSAPPAGYEDSTKAFLKNLDTELGTRNTAFITSPTADKGSIDAITSEVSGLNKGKLFYTTAQDYVEYINPKNFPSTIDTQTYSKLPKYVLPNAAEYSKATAEASNAFVATGGRNATVSDFCNALKKGNKAVILNNPAVDTPAWGEAKGRVENASKYLTEQLNAFMSGKKLPHPEVAGLTEDFLKNCNLKKLVKVITIDNQDSAAIKTAAKKVAQFLR